MTSIRDRHVLLIETQIVGNLGIAQAEIALVKLRAVTGIGREAALRAPIAKADLAAMAARAKATIVTEEGSEVVAPVNAMTAAAIVAEEADVEGAASTNVRLKHVSLS